MADLSISAALLSRLSSEPVLGVSMAHVSLLRLDRTGGLAPGNKSFKLQGNIAAAQRGGINRLVSFGGTWSNHLHALAAAAHEQGMESVGLVRGGEQDTAMLADARAWGMQVELLSRSDYRRRNDPEYLRQLAERYVAGPLQRGERRFRPGGRIGLHPSASHAYGRTYGASGSR